MTEKSDPDESKTGGVRRLVLDVLKLHDPSIISFAIALEQFKGVVA